MSETETITNTASSPDHKEIGWGSLSIGTYIKIAVLAVLFWYLFRDEIDKIVFRWIHDSSWSHGFLIPLFSLYFINQHKTEILSITPRSNYLGLFLMICCIVFYPLNIVQFKVGYFTPLTVIATLFTMVLFLGGWKLMRYAWLPVCYLIFAVPLPQRLYRDITDPMRQIAAQAATALLNLVPDLQATAGGVVIDVIYKGAKLEPALDVAEACSGMRLLMAFLALGVAMAYLHYRPVWQRLVLLCSTIPIAVLCNVVRVTVTGFIYILWDPKYAQGFYHDMLGLLMLPLAFGMYGGLAWFMANLFEESAAPVEDVIIRKHNQDGE